MPRIGPPLRAQFVAISGARRTQPGPLLTRAPDTGSLYGDHVGDVADPAGDVVEASGAAGGQLDGVEDRFGPVSQLGTVAELGPGGEVQAGWHRTVEGPGHWRVERSIPGTAEGRLPGAGENRLALQLGQREVVR